MQMASALVIKVKCGDTLRRFNARVDKNNQLDLDMARLRAKIISLFNLPADVNFILRYVDEDGDLVTLLDEDDLHDVMRQHLKFLRIDVHMSSESGSNSNVRLSGSATPLRSPPFRTQNLSGNAAIPDALKSVPAPSLEALSNLSLKFVSKAASSSPVVTAVTDWISKLGDSVQNSNSQPQVGTGSSSKNGVAKEPVTDNGVVSQFTSVDSKSNASPKVEAIHVTKGAVAGKVNVPNDLNTLPSEADPSKSTNMNVAQLPSRVSHGDGKTGKASTFDICTGEGSSSGSSTANAAHGNNSTHTAAMGSLSSSNLVECLYSGTKLAFGEQFCKPLNRSHNDREAIGGMFHKGIHCDGCGVCPITGPRFKSKVKEQYDLCSICLREMGNGTDYIRIDCPAPVCSPQSFKGVYEYPWMATLPHHSRTVSNTNNTRHKLDSRFIVDVNVMDGTIMAPSTPFTKIWRMQNNGSSNWPKGTKLVRVGGHVFHNLEVDLEILEDGLPVDKELDIAVDFRAPRSPGHYISYWRMALPTGEHFGERIWVHIQVDNSLMKESFEDHRHGLNFDILLDAHSSKGTRMIDLNESFSDNDDDDFFIQPNKFTAATEPSKPMVDEPPMIELENNFTIKMSAFDGHTSHPSTAAELSPVSYPVINFSETAAAVSSNKQFSDAVNALMSHPSTSAAPSSVSYPVIDFSETAPVVSPNKPSSAVDAQPLSIGSCGNNSVEQALLKELEEMGFKQAELNKEILKKNDYNLVQSIDDLCAASEWDHILQELREMSIM